MIHRAVVITCVYMDVGPAAEARSESWVLLRGVLVALAATIRQSNSITFSMFPVSREAPECCGSTVAGEEAGVGPMRSTGGVVGSTYIPIHIWISDRILLCKHII